MFVKVYYKALFFMLYSSILVSNILLVFCKTLEITCRITGTHTALPNCLYAK